MDSKEDPNTEAHRHNLPAENSDTVARQKKKARRVSFAETTAIRFFNRDEEDNETPFTENARIRDDSPGEYGVVQHLEFEGEEDGGNENDEDEEMDMRSTFLRPIGSPSPGGSTFGSASSNDEDNFFGPVSANFIRPGRLSDSAASDDDNHDHDLTMDSTAFSMHYRSLARSESGIDFKTPTEGQLFFEEKTPRSSTIGSSMRFTIGKKTIPAIPVTEVSGSHNSNDMSLVGENPSKYDYEKLSPGLDALLAESRKDLLHVSVSDAIITSPSPKRKESEILPSVDHEDDLINPSDYLREETAWMDSLDVLNEGEYAAHIEVGEANGRCGTFHSASSPNKEASHLMGAAASSSDNDKPVKSPYQLNKNGSRSPLASASSPVERQQIILTRASPSKKWELVSPMPQLGSMLRNESVERQEIETSIQKSISKLELLERSAFSSAYSAKADTSVVKTLDFFKSPNFDSLLGRNRHMSRINFVEDSLTEEKLPSVHQSKEKSYSYSVRPEIPNHISGEYRVKEYVGRIAIGKSPLGLRAENICKDQANYRETVSSPSKITWSGKNLMRNLFTLKNSNEDALMTESLLAETASGDGGKAIFTPDFVSSPNIRLGKKLSALPGRQSSQTVDIFVPSPLKQIPDFYKGRNLTPERSFADANLLTAAANSGVEVNSASGNGEIEIYHGNKVFGTIDNLSALAKEKVSQIMESEDLDIRNLAPKDMPRFEDNLAERDSGVDSDGSVSPSPSGDLYESRLQKNQVESTASPSRKERDNERSSGISTPIFTHPSGRQEKFPTSKRNVELLLRDTQHRVATTLMQKSPKLHKGGTCGPEAMLHPNQGGTALIVNERKKWTDTYSKFSEDIKNIVSGSADKLNSKMIDALEDRLVHQQRSKVYEMLHHGVMTQNSAVLHDSQVEKIAEIKSLLHRVAFEKAKLQLKHVKKEILLKRLQLLSSRIQESQTLGENIASQQLQRCTTNVVVDAVGDQTLSINLMKGRDSREVSHEKLTTMKQALDTVDLKISNLTRSFHERCGIKAEPSCVDTIALVNKHLMKRKSCRFIRMEMQMWVVHSISSENGQHNVTLNYLDYVIQSIKIFVGPAPSVSTSFKLNEANILKYIPNMDAYIAFAFVFNAETVRKYIGVRTLRQETQVTSSLLGTLLDVVEEIQLAQTEFPNLTQSNFCSPSVEQLDLILCFFNFTTGKKVSLTLDMSCLKRGIYPSEVAPIQLEPPGGDGEKSLPVYDKIKEAVKGVKTGYTRVLRLCKCVSQVVRVSTA